jgi:hypothetical protein
VDTTFERRVLVVEDERTIAESLAARPRWLPPGGSHPT